MVQKWSEPRYLPVKDDSSWHCDVYVDRKLFRTVKPVPTLEEAHNTVAHLAMHQIMVGRGYDHNCLILPTDERATATPAIEKRIASLLRSNTDPPKKIGTIVQYAGVTKPKVQLKSTASIKSQVTFRAPSTAPRAKSWKTSPESTQVSSNRP
jgi:hypothetical protein